MKEYYLEYPLHQIPRIIGLVDRNQLSATYGCFDRYYWHYKMSDFPSGMYQVFVLPLTLVYLNKFPGNRFYNQPRVKELALAGMRFITTAQNKDGSLNDYYPFERALGATAFALYACTESYLLLGIDDPELIAVFRRMADWLRRNDEPGVMANHHAVAAVALLNFYRISNMSTYHLASKKKIKQCLALQDEEGMFQEYEGCDPGYLTSTIDFLAKYYQKTRDRSLLKVLKKATKFAQYFMHPDQSYAGEYGSRTTYDFLPHGFEILARESDIAARIADSHLLSLETGKNSIMTDDKSFHIFAYNHLQAYLDYQKRRTRPLRHKEDFFKHFTNARMVVFKRGKFYGIVSLAKGGVLKLFKDDTLIVNDSGFIGLLSTDDIIVTNLVDNNKIVLPKDTIQIKGSFHKVKRVVAHTPLFVTFRSVMYVFGRISWLSHLIKKHLTKKLITSKHAVRVSFSKEIKIGKSIVLMDKITLLDPDIRFKKLYLSTDLFSTHTPAAGFYQDAVLKEWKDLGKYLGILNKERNLTIRREIA